MQAALEEHPSALSDLVTIIKANIKSGSRVPAQHGRKQAMADLKAGKDYASNSYGNIQGSGAQVIQRGVNLRSHMQSTGKARLLFDGIPDLQDELDAIRYTSRDMPHRLENMTKLALLGAKHLWITNTRVSICG